MPPTPPVTPVPDQVRDDPGAHLPSSAPLRLRVNPNDLVTRTTVLPLELRQGHHVRFFLCGFGQSSIERRKTPSTGQSGCVMFASRKGALMLMSLTSVP